MEIFLSSDGRMALGNKPAGPQPLLYLGCKVRLAPDFTLRSWFRLIDAHAPFGLINDFFEVLRAQAARCPSAGCVWPDFNQLAFIRVVEMIGYPGKPRMEIFNTLFGVEKGGGTTEIRNLPMEVLLDMPLVLGNLRHVVFGDKVDTFEFDTMYTLFEFIDGVAWELSFHGVPPECQLRS